MTRSSKHFLRTLKRLAKRTRKCACKSKKRHHRHRHTYRQRGGDLFSNPLYSNAIVPVKTEEGISIFRTADQAKELLNVSQQESYDGDVETPELVQNIPGSVNNKKLNNLRPQNKYNLPVENAES